MTSLHHFQMKNASPEVQFALKRQISPQNVYTYGHTLFKLLFILSKTLSILTILKILNTLHSVLQFINFPILSHLFQII